MYPKIILQKGKDEAIKRFHPWIFSGAIKSMDSLIKEGDIVEVYSYNDQFLGIGFYHQSSIAVRLISFSKQVINLDFWIKKIQHAFQFRVFLNLANSQHTNIYRLIFGEGDSLSSLIIDYVNGHCVFQAHTIAMHMQRNEIVEALKFIYKEKLISVYDKSIETLPTNYVLQHANMFLYGKLENEMIVNENGYPFFVDFINGQKTGFFIDQRENRKLLQNYCSNKNVLNTFSYSGGFSVYALHNKARHVHSIDSSEKAIQLCNQNIGLNKLSDHHSSTVIDAFDFIKSEGKQYDLIILDPPAFAKSKDVKHNAVQGYKRLNTLALTNIKKQGILFTFSCSGVIDKNLFYNTITAAAIESRRNIKLLHVLNQPADHPIMPNFPEGEYLKGLVFYVE